MPAVKLPEKQLTELRAFITLLKSQPSILHQPDLLFFKEYVESLGGVVPQPEKTEQSKTSASQECPRSTPKPAEDEEPEIVESDIELDQSGVVGKTYQIVSVN